MELDGKNVLITGGAGFIGSNLIDSIIDRCKIRVLDNLSAGKLSNIEHLINKKNFRMINGDIVDPAIVMRCMKGVDIIFHLAAFMEKASCAVDDPIKDLRVNTEGTLNILRAAQKEGVKKFIYTSSVAVYGQARYFPQDEEHPLNPNWPYGCSKLAAEKYVRTFYELYGLDTISLRIALAYGPREWYGRVMTIFIKKALTSESLLIFGNGEQTRDFVHVSDVVDQLILCAEIENLGGEVFNAGSGSRTSINALADKILEITGKTNELKKVYTDIEQGESGRKLAELVDLQCDMTKAKRVLGFSPKISLERGLRQHIEWAHENLSKW